MTTNDYVIEAFCSNLVTLIVQVINLSLEQDRIRTILVDQLLSVEY